MKMIPKSIWPWLNVLIPLALCTILLILRLADPGAVFEKFRLSILDGYQSLEVETGSAEETPARLVQIDDAALEAFGQWPWSRDKLGEILIALYEKGAAVVGVDLLLVEPDRLSPTRFLSNFPDVAVEPEQFANAFGYIDNDQFLSDVFAQTPSVLAIAASHKEGGIVDASTGFAWIGATPDALLTYNGLLAPTDTLKQSGVKVGHIAVRPDADGMLRRIPLMIRVGESVYPSLFLAMLANQQQASTILAKGVSGDDAFIETVKVGAYEIPVDDQGEMQVVPHYIPKSLPGLPLTEVLDGIHDAEDRGQCYCSGADCNRIDGLPRHPCRT